jgi:hypothetical protein
VQFNLKDAASASAVGYLDDPAALPGQVIVAGSDPGYLKYNGGGPVFLCGPDNPEDFLFRGKLNPDGTRSGGGQEEMIGETYHHPRRGRSSRVYMWSCAMTGMHCLEAYHHADRASDEPTLRDNGRVNAFMEQTDFYRMKPRDDLAAGSTRWVLANPPDSCIAYTYDYSGSMGIRGVTGGKYDLMWFDPVDGEAVTQSDVSVSSGNVTWTKPDSIGNEVALYIKRRMSTAHRST